ncbi:MAG: S8 family serine peptidase [Cytophagaceae bacterium]|nr:S8 family serine peptidase [Cytophagaceae bacterium]MDW8456012.1 S8 family serine peptidase [Cytophagaceae bacterium]
MRYIIPTVVAFILYASKSFAQENVFKKNTRHQSFSTTQKIVPNSAIVKLKPEYKHLFKQGQLFPEPLKAWNACRKECNITNITPLFPHMKSPDKTFNERGERLVDLSLIYKVEFKSNKSLEDILELAFRTGLFEYVEPQYEEELLFIPNDTLAQPSANKQYYLQRIKAFEAWDIEDGDTNVVIGVIDTGTDLTHPDLAGNIKYNWADPIDGIDNDSDGFIDNFYGWDVGQNDNNPSYNPDHGMSVQGACCATTNNVTGIAGTGFKCKALPIKITNSGGSITAGYQGIIYAADHGCDVINLSWGGFGSYVQLNQDIINYAAINHDVVVVAAAGNSNAELDFYPASYDNVLSVTGVDTVTSVLGMVVERRNINTPTTGGTYSFKVDMASHITGWTTAPSGGYKFIWGTSFASPVVAGAAGIVRAKYPHLKAPQVIELLRVSGSILDTFPETRPESRYKTGRLLNMYKALTNLSSPAIRSDSIFIKSRFSDKQFFSGDTLTITNYFYNYLSRANNLKVTLRTLHPQYVQILDSISIVGTIDSLTGKKNTADPFKIRILPHTPTDQKVDIVMILQDPSKNYYDYQGFKISVNPNYITIDTNRITFTVTSKGKLGYNDDALSVGEGFKYDVTSMLYEGGLMIGAASNKVSDCVRGTFGAPDNDFKPVQTVRYINSPGYDVAISTVFNDSLAANKLGLEIEQITYANKNSPNDKHITIEYIVKNNSSTTYDSLFVGIFADWDINFSTYAQNRADWDDETKMAYTYHTAANGKYAGIALLSPHPPSCFSIDNNASLSGNINPNDGFTTSEKFQTLSQGIKRRQAGVSGSGWDVSQVIAAKLTNLLPGQSQTVGFALLAGDNFYDLKVNALNAINYYKQMRTGPVPNVSDAYLCQNQPANITIAPTNGTKFKFYDALPLGTPIAQASSLTLNNVSSPDTIYVVNSDKMFDSPYKTVYIKFDAIEADFQMLPETLQLGFNQTVYFINKSTGASSINWNFGNGNTSTAFITSSNYTSHGTYPVRLIATSPNGCKDTLIKNLLVLAPPTDVLAENHNSTLLLHPNPVKEELVILLPSTGDRLQNVSIVNALGTLVYSSHSEAGELVVPFGQHPPGVYFVKIDNAAGSIIKKIIKE